MSHYLQKLTDFFNKFLGRSEHKLSERLACRVIGQVCTTQRYARQPHGGLHRLFDAHSTLKAPSPPLSVDNPGPRGSKKWGLLLLSPVYFLTCSSLLANELDPYVTALEEQWGKAIQKKVGPMVADLVFDGGPELGFLCFQIASCSTVDRLDWGGSMSAKLKQEKSGKIVWWHIDEIGGRPLKNPVPVWQGKVYLRHGTDSLIEQLLAGIGMRGSEPISVKEAMAIAEHEFGHWFQMSVPTVLAYERNRINHLIHEQKAGRSLAKGSRRRGLSLLQEIESHGSKSFGNDEMRFRELYNAIVSEAGSETPSISRLRKLMGQAQGRIPQYEYGGKATRKAAAKWALKIFGRKR